MIKPEQIPDEVVQHFIKANNGCECHECVSVAIAAAINAWPDMRDIPGMTHDGDVYHRMLHIPVIPKEKNDD